MTKIYDIQIQNSQKIKQIWATEIDQWVKVLITKLSNLS